MKNYHNHPAYKAIFKTIVELEETGYLTLEATADMVAQMIFDDLKEQDLLQTTNEDIAEAYEKAGKTVIRDTEGRIIGWQG